MKISVPVDVKKVVNGMEDEATLKLKSLADEFKKELGEVTANCKIGIPAEEIVKIAESESAQLIVLGTHGWTGISSICCWEASRKKYSEWAKCPVLVVRTSGVTHRSGRMQQTLYL